MPDEWSTSIAPLLEVGTPGGSEVIIGSPIPAELSTYYLNTVLLDSISTVYLGMYTGDGSYYYQVVGIQGGGANEYYGEGWVDSAHVVHEVRNQIWETGTTDFTVTWAGRGNIRTMDFGPFTGQTTHVFRAGVHAILHDLNDPTQIERVDTRVQPRGIAYAERFSGAPFSSVTSTAETIMATTTNPITFYPRRAYEVEWYGIMDDASATSVNVQPRVRRTGLAGTNMASGPTVDTQPSGQDTPFWRKNYVANFSSSPSGAVSSVLVLTFQPNSAASTVNLTGTGSAANWLKVTDVGSADDFPDATSI